MTTNSANTRNLSSDEGSKESSHTATEANTEPSQPSAEQSVLAVGESIAARRQHIDELDKAIVSLSRHIDAATYELLVLLREFDERAGWLKWSSTDCAHWLAWRCDLGLGAAREKVRVAHALKLLPKTSAAFSEGHLSYSKARAITRVATEADEAEFLKLAACMTAAHLEQHCRQRRNATNESTITALTAHKRRFVRSWRDHERGLLKVTIELPMEEGMLFEKALDKASYQNAVNEAEGQYVPPPDEKTSWNALQADALVTMSRDYLSGAASSATANKSISTADNFQVVIHVDKSALSNNSGMSEVPVETAKRLCCDGSIVTITESSAGEPLNVGRKQRTVSAAIRRALHARDGGCAFPGCSHQRFLDAHHIEHWANNGETSLANTLLLCTRHHKLVHEGGYSIKLDQSGRHFFQRPDGRSVPASGYQMNDWHDDQDQRDNASVNRDEYDRDANECEKVDPVAPGVRDSAGSYYVNAVSSFPRKLFWHHSHY